MKTPISLLFACCAGFLAGAFAVSPSRAENRIGVAAVTAAPGETVTVPIVAKTDRPLTLLNAEIAFDRALCDVVDNQAVRQAGRSDPSAGPTEGGLKCPEQGGFQVVFFNLNGATVIPPGDGPIAEWTFRVRDDAPASTFPVEISVNQTSQGPAQVPLAPSGATLTIAGTGHLRPDGSVTCPGDCGGDGVVTVDELMRGVTIALDSARATECAASDLDGNGTVTVAELLGAVHAALSGCPGAR